MNREEIEMGEDICFNGEKFVWDNPSLCEGGVVVFAKENDCGLWVRTSKDTFTWFKTDFRKYLRKRRFIKKGKR